MIFRQSVDDILKIILKKLYYKVIEIKVCDLKLFFFSFYRCAHRNMISSIL